MKANRLWNRESLFSKSIIKIPINDYNFDLYDRQPAEKETRGGAVLAEALVIQPQSGAQPSSELINGVKQISSMLEGVDDELAKAVEFQKKLASRWSSGPSDGYNREPVEVTYKTHHHLTGDRWALSLRGGGTVLFSCAVVLHEKVQVATKTC